MGLIVNHGPVPAEGDDLAEPDRFSLSRWSRALTLRERAAHWRISGRVSRPVEDATRAARRLARWQAQNPFRQDGFFGRRLAQDGIGEEDLLRFLGEGPETVASRMEERPAWLLQLERAWTVPPAATFPLDVDYLDGSPHAEFLQAVRPLLDRAFSDLTAGLRELAERFPSAPFDPAATGGLLAENLPLSFVILLNRAMVLELHLAGQAGQLTGGTPEERFQSFIDRLRDPATSLEVLGQYPVLARQLAETASRWVEFSLEILGHLAADAERLREVFSPDRELGVLTELHTGQGDSHRGGRSVVLLRFDSGLGLVYKPRPLAVDAAFQDFLAWTEARGFAPAFRRLRVLDFDGHGWVERVQACPCSNAEEVERFYLRQGGYLALLFALSAIDMHHENLIAVGEHPVLVDLEALLHPLDEPMGSEELFFPDTVLRIGFLPTADWGGGPGEAGADLSGLAAMEGQFMPRPMLMAEAAGTDQMRFSRRPVTVDIGEHRPTLQGAAVDLSTYTGAVVEGFRRMIRLLATHRAELLSADGPLAPFAGTPVRFLVRKTLAYSNLSFEGQHPYLLGDALDRDRHLDHLWSAAPETPDLERLIAAEHRDMERGDVPMFTCLPSSTDVWTSDGERIERFLKSTALELVRERLRRIDDAEIARQTWIVESALVAVAGGRPSEDRHEVRETEAPASPDELLSAALEVGLRLEALSFSRGEANFWLAQKPQDGPYPCVLSPATPDLYLGISGIVLFLAQLGFVTGEPRFTRLARGGVITLRAQITREKAVTDIGGFAGWGAIVYTLTQVGALWRDEELLDAAEQVAAPLGPRIDADDLSDVVGGAAGCLAALLGLHSQRPAGPALSLALRCGERLLARARPMEPGLGWVLELAGQHPLAGFSHGAAGISWALLQLDAVVGDGRFEQAARGALKYERSLYRASGGWPDLRFGTLAGQHSMCAWCHGAPGIALGRLDSLRFLDDAAMREDIATAVGATLADGFGKGHSLCHGDLGNLEPIALAAEVLGDPDLAGGVLASIREHGYRFGLLNRGEIPGLMLGLAGIGYGLLRLAAPDRVPSVLRLARPIDSTDRLAGAG
jgi:type 2 lantibiotic biosynthesis protein LanM